MRHLMATPEIAALASDARLVKIARLELSADAVPFRATLFEKSAQTNWLIPWHQDTALPLTAKFDSAGWTAWSQKEGRLYAHAPAWALSRVIALRIHLDASTADNGPLRVLPYSHLAGILTDHSILEYANQHDNVTCLVPRGVLTMRPLLIHSSSKIRAASLRRVLHIEYADSLDLAPAIRLAVT
jgi:ectoine hydroxylase-related dioxygenase (phytanoyl-CoA dioxygenase family)